MSWRAEPPPPPPPAPESLLTRHPRLGVILAIVLGVGAVAALALAVVSGGDDPDTPPATVADGTLKVAVVGLKSLDPLEAREPVDVMVVDQLFDTLVVYEPKTFEPKPGLASWDVNPEQTQFTFRLAEGATFHDGSPVTAADVKYTLERIARKGSMSPLLAQLEPVAGYRAYAVDGTAPGLAGVEVPDAATVAIRLDHPFAEFPAALAHPGFGIVPRAAVEAQGANFRLGPVGSGPFRVGTVEEDRVVVNRFAEHRKAAKLATIDFVRFDDVDAAYRAFVAGDLDLAPVPPAAAGAAAEEYGRRGMGPYVGIVFYGMNLKSPDLARPELRQAVSLAIDRGKIVRDAYQSSVQLATGLVAQGVPGRAADACGDRCRHDPEAAKGLLASAFPGGAVPEIAVDFDADPTQTAVANSIKADLEAAGIPVVLRPHPFEEYGQFLVSGGAELFRLGWIANFPSADGFLTPLFQSTSPENLTGLASADIDARLAAAQAEDDPAKRQGLYREIEQRILEQFVVVPVAQLEIRQVVASRVKSFSLNPIGTFDGAAVTLSVE